MRMGIFASVLAAVLLAAPLASAGPTDVAIYVTRLGGDTASAQPFVDRFLRYIEGKVGWPTGSAKGSYLVTRKSVEAAVESQKPALGMLEPALYFEMRKTWSLQPFLMLESKDLVSPRLHVVVKDPAIQSLADLKGKRLWTMLADTPTYLSKVVLDGRANAATDFTLKQIGQALKGVRGLLRGDCDATILDDDQLASAKQITGGEALRVIATSPALPPIPVVALGTGLSAADRDALARALTAMCGTSDGGAICKEMHIGRFVPLDPAVLGDVQKRYGDQ